MRTIVITYHGTIACDRGLRVRNTIKQLGGVVQTTSYFPVMGECDIEAALPENKVAECIQCVERDGCTAVVYGPD